MKSRNSPRLLAAGTMALLVLASRGADAQLSIRDASVMEGNSGAASLNVPIEISTPRTRAVDIEITSLDGLTDPANAGSDYSPLATRVRLAAGTQSTLARVSVFGDLLPELDETLRLRIGRAFEVRPPDFSTPRDFAAGSSAQTSDMAVADFDGDGRPDIAATSFYSDLVAVLRNTSAGDGVDFAPQVTFGAGNAPRNIAAGDIDGDGKIDLVVVDQFDGAISVLRNTSTRSSLAFEPAVAFPITGIDVALADVDGDGALDVGVVDESLPGISILRNLSTAGNIAFATRVNVVTADKPIALAFGDLDGDGRADLAAPRDYNLVGVFHNLSTPGSIVFGAETALDGLDRPQRIVIHDVDGDGRADIVTSSRYYYLAIYRNETTPSGSFRFTRQQLSGLHSDNDALAVDDLDGDGRPDLLVPATGLFVYPGASSAGSIAFAPSRQYQVDGSTTEVAVADFDGDGVKDVALSVSHNQIRPDAYINVLQGRSRPGEIVLPQRYDIEFGNASPRAVTSADFDGNGTPDLAFSDSFAGNVYLAFNASVPGTMAFGDRCDVSVGYGVVGIQSGDLDGDGKPDLVIPDYSNDLVMVLANRQASGSSCSWPRLDLGTGDQPLFAVVGDLDGDGRQDLLATEYGGSALSAFINRSTGGNLTFAPRQPIALGARPRAIQLADLDADGKADVVLSMYDNTALTILRNTTSAPGAFRTTAAASPLAGTDPAAVAAGDFDGDGKIDVAVSLIDDLVLLRNVSTAAGIQFDAPLRQSIGTQPGNLEARDLDRDGDIDLVVVDSGGDVLRVLENVSSPGNLAFLPPIDFALPGQGGSALALDLDGDGVTDLAVPGGNSGRGHILPGIAVPVAVARREAIGTILDDDRDTDPNSFVLTDQSDVPPGTVRTSNTVTVRGINFPTPFSVTGGESSKNGGSFTTAAGSVIDGDTLTVRHVASVQYSTTTQTQLSVGSFSETFASTTVARDAEPDNFGFVAQNGAPVGSVRESNTVTITGINGTVSVSITGGEYRIDGGPYCSTPGALEENSRLQLRHTASPSPATATRTTVTVGSVSRDFVSTTEAADTTPDAAGLNFAERRNVARNTAVESGAATVTGINAASSVIVSGGEYRINGGSYRTAAGNVSNGDVIQLRQTSASEYSTRRDTTVTVGGVSATFSTFTETAPDVQPDAFAFTTVRNAAPGALTESETVVISGLSAASTISISGGEYRINGGAYTTASGSISNSDRVSARTVAPLESGASKVVTVTIGGVTGTFTVVAQSVPAAGGDTDAGGGGALGGSLLSLLAGLSFFRRRTT